MAFDVDHADPVHSARGDQRLEHLILCPLDIHLDQRDSVFHNAKHISDRHRGDLCELLVADIGLAFDDGGTFKKLSTLRRLEVKARRS